MGIEILKKLQNVLIILTFMLIVYTCAQTVEIYQTKDSEFIVDEEQMICAFRDDYTWYRQIYDRAAELAEEHGLYQFLDMEEPWISSEGNYCT